MYGGWKSGESDQIQRIEETNSKMQIHTVTILGANGTMGRNIAAIFASFGGAQVYLVSRTKEKSIRAKDKAYQSVRAESVKEKMIPADYSELDECIRQSDLVFEACAEDWNIKVEIHSRIAEILTTLEGKGKIICTGTSGLSITGLAELYPEEYRCLFIGMHFFNPPYNMPLCELTPTKYSDRTVFEEVFDYGKKVLFRTMVEVKDSPAFLGNRIGFQFINEALQTAEKYKYNGGIDYIDAILGPFTGRAMAPLVTADFVGLDVHKAIVDNLYENTNDYAHNTLILPQFAEMLIKENRLGRKTGEGLYKTIIHDSGAKIRQVYDIEHGYYRNVMKYQFPFVEEMVSAFQVGDYERGFAALINNHSLEADLCCTFLLKYILYSLEAAKDVGYDIHSADDVMAAGFNWCPPLAILEALGGAKVVEQLCVERLEQNILEKIQAKELLESPEPSRYDYRRFIKAKH